MYYGRVSKAVVTVKRVIVSILYRASKLAISTVDSDATRQARAMTSLLSMTAYQNPSIRPIFYIFDNLIQIEEILQTGSSKKCQ